MTERLRDTSIVRTWTGFRPATVDKLRRFAAEAAKDGVQEGAFSIGDHVVIEVDPLEPREHLDRGKADHIPVDTWQGPGSRNSGGGIGPGLRNRLIGFGLAGPPRQGNRMILPIDVIMSHGAGTQPGQRHQFTLDLDFDQVELAGLIHLADIEVEA